MMEPIQGVADDMMRYIDESRAKKADGVIDMKEIFQGESVSKGLIQIQLSSPSGLAVNTICKCAFGVNTDAHHNPNDDLIKYGNEIFAGFRPSNVLESALLSLFFYFPGFEKIIPVIPPAYDKIHKIGKDIAEQR